MFNQIIALLRYRDTSWQPPRNRHRPLPEGVVAPIIAENRQRLQTPLMHQWQNQAKQRACEERHTSRGADAAKQKRRLTRRDWRVTAWREAR